MSNPEESLSEFAKEMLEALVRSHKLAREDAIKYGTSLVFWEDGKIVFVTAEELKAEVEAEKASNQESTGNE